MIIANALVEILNGIENPKIKIMEHIKLSYGDGTNKNYMSMASKYIKLQIQQKYGDNTKYNIIKFY